MSRYSTTTKRTNHLETQINSWIWFSQVSDLFFLFHRDFAETVFRRSSWATTATLSNSSDQQMAQKIPEKMDLIEGLSFPQISRIEKRMRQNKTKVDFELG
jgi:hypothetical protein